MADERTLEVVLRARDEASKTINQVAHASDGLSESFKRNLKEAGLFAGGVLGSLGLLTQAAVANAASYEQNRIAFESMLGSADKARVLLKQVSDFAQKTPFELPQVVQGSRQLLAYGIEAKNIIPTFKMLGDISAGVGTDKLPQLIVAFGQVRAATKLTGMELRQFSEAGVPLLDALVKNANKAGGMLVTVGGGAKKAKVDVKEMNDQLGIARQKLKEATDAGKAKESTLMTLRNKIENYEGKLSSASTAQQTFTKRVKVTKQQMMEMISEGKVSAEQVEQALSGMTTKGGLFFEGMERQSKTFNGVMSNVRDNFGKFVREIVGISDQGDIREGSLFASLKVGAEGLLRALEELRPKATAAVNAFISNKSAVIALAGALGGMLVLAIGAFVAAFGPAIAIMTAVAAAGAGVAYALTRIDDIARTLVPQLAAATAAVFVLNGGFVGLFATIAANPLGALAIAVLAVASGVVYLATQTDLLKTKEDFLRQAQDNVKTAQDQLKISTDQLAGARENLKDVELRLEGANLAMIRAQRNVIDVQRRYGESSFEAKEARHQLEQAEREAEKAITAGKDALVQADTAQQNFIANSKKLKEADDKVVETRNIHKTSWEQIRDSIGGAIGKLMEWNDAAMRFGIGVGGPSGIKLPKFADGGWVPQTGPAIVHAGEFVLSRDMLRGRDPIPSNVVERNQTNSVQIGPVYVRNESDIQSLSQRLDYMLRTSGSL